MQVHKPPFGARGRLILGVRLSHFDSWAAVADKCYPPVAGLELS
jgi:hypothetical protein